MVMTRVESYAEAKILRTHLAFGADLTALGAAAAVALFDLAEHSSP